MMIFPPSSLGLMSLGVSSKFRMSRFCSPEESLFDRMSLIASAGGFSLYGTNVSMRATRLLPASSGSFDLSGTGVALLKSSRIGSTPGSFLFFGENAGLNYSGGAVASGGEYLQVIRRRRI